MERLTAEIAGNNYGKCRHLKRSCPDNCAIAEEPCEGLQDIFDRLAAYEDTGLTPEEISKWKEALGKITSVTGDRILQIVNAEQEGRLVVLPCKVGDTVYVFYAGRRNCKWPCNMKKGKIYEVIVSGMRLHDWSDDWSVLLFFDTKEMSGDYEFSFTEFGKTIFSTRSKAEAAMKGA